MNTDRTWFAASTYDSVSLRKQKVWPSSMHTGPSVTIRDRAVIDSWVEKISAIPVDGPEMISWGPGAEVLEVTFHSSTGDQDIAFYNGRIKTPSTGFLSIRDAHESAIYKELLRYLGPFARVRRAMAAVKRYLRR